MKQASASTTQRLKTIFSDTFEGFFQITHSGFALIGLALVSGVLALVAHPALRTASEAQLMHWLQSRHPVPEAAAVASVSALPAPLERSATVAISPQDLSKSQASITQWLSKKYRVAPELLSALVVKAFEIGHNTKLDPTLILAVMAVESRFNPFAQSHVGAQGLMQVMTHLHGEKYESVGGTLTAFDPIANLDVGVKVLQECIANAGSVEGGLRYYVGAANLPDDGGYTSKVLAERDRLQIVAMGGTPASAAPAAPASTQQARAAAEPSSSAKAKVAAPAPQTTPDQADAFEEKIALIAGTS